MYFIPFSDFSIVNRIRARKVASDKINYMLMFIIIECRWILHSQAFCYLH